MSAPSSRTPTTNFGGQIEHYGRDFQMDTAFYNRTGFTAGWSFGEINFYPKSGTDFWIQRIHPFYFTKIGYDDIQGGKEAMINAGIRFNLTRQGFINISHSGLSIYYDPVDHFQGRSWFAHSGFDFQPNQHLTISLNGNSISFDRADTGEPVYDVTIGSRVRWRAAAARE